MSGAAFHFVLELCAFLSRAFRKTSMHTTTPTMRLKMANAFCRFHQNRNPAPQITITQIRRTGLPMGFKGNEPESTSLLLRMILARRSLPGLLALLVDFANLHGLIDCQIGIADRRSFGCGWVASAGGKICAVAANGIRVAFALSARHPQCVGRD